MSDADPFDDGEQNKAREAQEKKLIDRNISDLRRVMSLVEGRRFIWRVLQEAGVYRDSFDTNALVMAKLNGERRIGTFILSRITPEEELRMKSEARADKLLRDTIRENSEAK